MKTSLNILPYTLRRRRLFRLRLFQWLCVWGLAGAAAGALVYWTTYVPYRDCLADLQAHRREYEPLKKLQTELDAMRSQMGNLRKREALALSLADEIPDLTLLGTISRAARQSGGSVYVERMSLDREATPVRPDENGASAGQRRRGTLTLRGAGVDNLSVARFVAALHDPEVFDSVELKSTGRQAARGTEAFVYDVECVF